MLRWTDSLYIGMLTAYPRSDLTSHTFAYVACEDGVCVRDHSVSGRSALCFLEQWGYRCSLFPSLSLDPSLAASQQAAPQGCAHRQGCIPPPCRIYSGYGPLCDHTCRHTDQARRPHAPAPKIDNGSCTTELAPPASTSHCATCVVC
jgi:hypothetical protein